MYDYTKFHIGIYLSAAGGLAALISIAAQNQSQLANILSLICFHWLLGVAFLVMVLAGIAAAIVATSAIASTSYQDFSERPQGAFGCTPFTGKTWTTIAHGSFWGSLAALAFAVFTAPTVREWLRVPVWLGWSLVLAVVAISCSSLIARRRWKTRGFPRMT